MSDLLQRSRAEGTPLLDGDRATFVWQGPTPPDLAGDFNGWGRNSDAATFAPAGWEVWATSVALPRDAYIEYHYRDDGTKVLDPFNRRTITDGLGGRNNYFYMPEARSTSLVRSLARVPHGTVSRHVVYDDHRIATGKRTVHLYRPPTDEPCPLLVVFDGDEYVRRARLPQILDNLIDERRIRPLAVAFVDHGQRARFVEYMCSDAHLDFLLVRILPLAQQHLNLVDLETEPGAYGVCGASMGGLISLYAGVRVPRIFGHVLSQSGSFSFHLKGRETIVHELIRHGDGVPISVYLDAGRYEPLLDSNRHMGELLAEKGHQVTFHEYNGGHNYTSWRNDLGRGLEVLYPPVDAQSSSSSA